MNTSLLQYKVPVIINIYKQLVKIVGDSYFDPVDFWDGDNYAIGLKKQDKLVYISNWDYKNNNETDVRYYADFEIVNAITFETVTEVKRLENISSETLCVEIISFFASGQSS